MFFTFIEFLLSDQLSMGFSLFKSFCLVLLLLRLYHCFWFLAALLWSVDVDFLKVYLALKFNRFLNVSHQFWEVNIHYFLNCCFYPIFSLLSCGTLIHIHYILSLYLYVSYSLQVLLLFKSLLFTTLLLGKFYISTCFR